MLLSDRDLVDAVIAGHLAVDPFDRAHVQPASIDVCLGREFRVFTGHRTSHVDPLKRDDDLTEPVEVPPGEPFVLHPGEFVLGTTLERVALGPTLAARLEGKSSLGRLGLLVHSTAGFIDPGFAGTVTLELSNVNTLPVLLWPGMRVGQLCVFRTSSPVDRPYGSAGLGSRYQHQDGPVASRSWLYHVQSS